jgi:hypothetical protein
MKKSVLFLMLACFGLFSSALAQDTLATWTFPTGDAADSLADGGIHAGNYSISTFGGTSAMAFKNGLNTKAAQATGWDGGANTKGWEIGITSAGYKDIQVMSKQSSGGNNPGPRDFKLQYSLDNSTWNDVASSEVTVQNDWTSGVLSVGLPADCNNVTDLKLRWIMTSDTASDGNPVASNGTSKIEDIYIMGTVYNSGIDHSTAASPMIYPNPVQEVLNLAHIREFALFNSSGQEIMQLQLNAEIQSMQLTELDAGIYFIRYTGINGVVESTTLIKK